jgi:predicted TIM-barrel fold metal-dependent hydrolase
MIIDVHAHLFRDPDYNEAFHAACMKAGIDRICAFLSGGVSTGRIEDDPNRQALDLRAAHPESVIALARVDHAEGQPAVDELARLVEEEDMRGLKLSFTVKANDPTLYPVVEKTIDLKIPILFHTFMGRHTKPARYERYPGETDVLELIDLALRYPEAVFVMAHYNLGDWEYGIKAVKSVRNIYPSTSGSGVDGGSVEFGVREAGAERIIFGTDNVLYGAMGKIYGANISEEDRALIFGGNLMRLLTARGPLS